MEGRERRGREGEGRLRVFFVNVQLVTNSLALFIYVQHKLVHKTKEFFN